MNAEALSGFNREGVSLELFTGFVPVFRITNDADEIIEVPQREQECLKVFRAVFCFIEQEASTAHDHLTTVLDERVKCIHDRELLGAALVNGQHVHPEGCFHGGEFEYLVNNNLWSGVTLESDLDACLLIREVTHSGDIREHFFTDQLCNTLL